MRRLFEEDPPEISDFAFGYEFAYSRSANLKGVFATVAGCGIFVEINLRVRPSVRRGAQSLRQSSLWRTAHRAVLVAAELAWRAPRPRRNYVDGARWLTGASLLGLAAELAL